MFKSFQDAARRRALTGAIVNEFDCRGCMAEDHVFVRAGRVVGFETLGSIESVLVEVLNEGSRSFLDWPERRIKRIPLHHQGLQKIANGYWCLYK